ncbi:hypothetical protein HF086_006432 [Spodoptera exigua]|uniref:Uncharacterized protein n=1 Tax=Spodoptera exigua TaxID=7107 RepID=A0A922SP28_SPOEX|nr:hypothetical protein HF086_006432 [Spodoptera exigua]
MSFDLFNSSEAKEEQRLNSAWIFSFFLDMWIIKSLILVVSLSFCCEKFYRAISNVQNSCSIVLKLNCSDNDRRLCKNVQRLHRATFNKMTVCRFFVIDACFPLNMLALLANYVIVLLQFAFL